MVRNLNSNIIEKTYPIIACCGLDCGLCPTYYTKGPSKCPGCCGPDFFSKHPSCSIITCCVKKNGFETCAECSEFICSKLKGWDIYDSFICHRVSLANLSFISKKGIEAFLSQQNKRIKLLERMLEYFNEGRSKSFFCLATALIPITDLEHSLNGSQLKIKNDGIMSDDFKTKSKILKECLNHYANKRKIRMKLIKK